MSQQRLPKHLRKVIRLARKAGWEVGVTGSGHWRFRSPEGPQVVVSGTPSDRRTWLNDRAELRRAGLTVD